MMARSRPKLKRTTSDASSINPRIIILLLVVVGTCVFLWGYYNANANNASASSPENEKTIITRPVDQNGNE